MSLGSNEYLERGFEAVLEFIAPGMTHSTIDLLSTDLRLRDNP
jgi:hypothetical protein